MSKWATIENIVIYIVVGLVLFFTRQPLVLLMLFFVNYRRYKKGDK